MAGIHEISCEVRRRRWNWLGHVLRREGENDCFTALGWTPEAQNVRGRPKTTWRRTVEREREREKQGRVEELECSQGAARNRECWSENVSALCAYWRGET